MFIDVHCHLDMLKEPEKLIENAKSKNVLIVSNGVNGESNREILKLAGKNVKICFGIYPIDALKLTEEEMDKEIDFIRKNSGKIIGIGEVGMDFKESNEKERQENVFKRFINLSMELNKPIIVHSRKAEAECIEVLERFKAKKVIMHCFSGNFKLVRRIIDDGWYLTIPTSVTFSEHFQKVAEMTDIKQLLCETDSPYLHPEKKFPNEPANVVESYRKISEIKKIDLKKVEKQIEGNFNKLFLSSGNY